MQKLSVVVPVTRMSGRLQKLYQWLPTVDTNLIRVIIVHDSQDGTTGLELIQMISELNLEAKVEFVEGTFLSPGKARNAGLKHATTPWIAFWDSDDLPNPDKFLDQILKADETQSQMVIGNYEEVTPDGKICHKFVDWAPLELQIALNPGLWRMAFVQLLIENESFVTSKMGEDQIFLAKIFAKRPKIYKSDATLYSYFCDSPTQATKNTFARMEIFNSLSTLRTISNEKHGSLAELFRIRIFFTILLNKDLRLNRKQFVECLLRDTGFILLKSWKIYQLASMRKSFNKTNSKFTFLLFGGLGNRIFQIVAARELTVSNDLNFDFNHDLSKQGFNLRSGFEAFEVSKHLKLVKQEKQSIFKVRLVNLAIRFSSKRRKHFKIFKSIFTLITGINYQNGLGFDPEFRPKPGRYLNLGYFQTHIYADRIGMEKLKLEFSLVAESKAMSSALEHIKNKPHLGVQIRLGDYLRNPLIGPLDIQYFLEELSNIGESKEFDSVFIFSDDAESARHLLSSFSNLRKYFVSDFSLTTEEEFFLLSQMSELIISNSTFGWWGAYLAGKANIKAPTPWFNDLQEPLKLIPPSWRRIPRTSALSLADEA
jgi:glycosyltransferase involved in cell wall biosynthesis